MPVPTEALISSYARWRTSPLGRITDRLERDLLFELLGPVGGRTILDVGCGDGNLAADLTYRGAVVTAVDRDAAMIGAARQRMDVDGIAVRLCQACGTRLPFENGVFDRVTAVTMLCFVAMPEPIFAEMARVLKPGGTLIVGDLGRWSLWGGYRRVRALLGDATWHSATFRTASQLTKLIENAGLVAGQVRGGIYYPPHARAARLLAPVDRWLGQKGTFGAAFIAISATKPHEGRSQVT